MKEADLAYRQLEEILAGISEPLSWSRVSLAPEAYLHTNGTIIGIVQHIAVCKFIYASAAFRSLEIRWRDCFDRLETIGTSWDATVAYSAEAQTYWLASW